MNARSSKAAAPGRTLRTIGGLLRPHRVAISAMLGLTVVGSAAGAVEPLVYKRIFDVLGRDGPADVRGVCVVLCGLGALLLAREALGAFSDWLSWRVRIAVDFTLLQRTVECLHARPLTHHRQESVGALMTKMQRGISGTMTAFSTATSQLVPSVAYLAISTAAMIALDVRLAAVVLVLAPAPAILGALASPEQIERERDLMKRWVRLFSRLTEVLAGIAVVKSFVKEADETRRFLRGVDEANGIVVRGVATDATLNAVRNAIMAVARILALALGAWLVFKREITVGTVVAFVGYVTGIFQPVQALTGTYQTLRKGAVSFETVMSLLDSEDALEHLDETDAAPLETISGAVTFEHVSFEYAPGRAVLRDVDLGVQPGEMIAVVGPSGSGKSTMMAVLQRFFDPTRGRVLLDGVDARRFGRRAVRSKIAVVLQEAVLFDDTIRENIAFGRPSASDEEIEAAARAANAHDFVTRLPHGYDTRIGERGCNLSGGERQRIAIARALLKDAPILVLDEATSALDAESEDAVRDAIARLARGRTTFVIAHRLSTVVAADRIVVLSHGRIVESGRHEDLVRAGGIYADLVARQTRGLIGAAA